MATRWRAALLVAWLCVSFLLLEFVQPAPLLPFTLTILATVGILALLRPPWAVPALIGGIVVYTALWLWLERDTGNPVAVLAVVPVFAGALWRSQRLVAHLLEGSRAAWGLRRQIEGLSNVDEVTHLYKATYGLQVLADQVELCRRYQRTLSLVRIGISHPEDWVRVHGTAQLRVLHRDLATLIKENVRTTDRVAVMGTAEYMVVMSETPATVAQAASHRLAYLAQSQFEVELRVGIADYPASGLSVDELNAEAQAALNFARNADLTVVAQD
ncbi:MAG: diguanylate cyclase [Chloroflexota bacterium]